MSAGFRMLCGWMYSLFVGVVFFPFVLGVGWVDHWPIFSLPTAIFTLGGVIAARLGVWLAWLYGGRDYGARSFLFTFIVYVYLCGAFGVVVFHIGHPVTAASAPYDAWYMARHAGLLAFAWYFLKASLAAALFVAMAWGVVIFIACALTMVLFHRLL
jgi:hypothetical protein